VAEVVRIHGLVEVQKMLTALPHELKAQGGAAVRNALRKAARVLLVQAKANLQQIIDTPNVDGETSKTTGLLQKNVVVSRGRPTAGTGEVMLVRVRKKSYPAERGARVSTLRVGSLLEQGTEKRQPMPWMRPAFDTKKEEAVAVFTDDVLKRLRRVYAKHNKG
jgi:HK97 gp10 family phage protein